MRIVHIAAEFAPLAKTGGLGEVLLGLPREQALTASKVEIILPKYDFINLKQLSDLTLEIPNFKCLDYPNTMWSGRLEGCSVHLLDARHPAGYFHRSQIYGCDDDIPRFIYFSRAALEYLKIKNETIDILHIHDWHTALCAPMVKNLFKDLKVKAIVQSIHNLEYQGKCAVNDLNQIGLDGESYRTPDQLQDDNPKYPQTINLLKGGIVYSDAVIAVSPTYAQEILTPQYGFNLNKTLLKHKHKVKGILNGIDQKIWNPSEDPSLKPPYSIEGALNGKQKNKEALAKKFSLHANQHPWIGTVTRLVPQKGPELIEDALNKTLELGGVFLLLGSSPIKPLQEHFNKLKKKYEGNPHVLLNYDYNEELAHQIFAALDFLIVPSHFEPCGLTQLIAMRYGTIPIVRSTGGLKDTVFDCEDSTIPTSQRNGFTFTDPTTDSMNKTLQRAFHLFKNEHPIFQSMIRRAMGSDFSWKKPAKEYLRLYHKLIG